MKAKYYVLAIVPLCAVAVVLRVLEIIYAIEGDTGFYIQSSPIPVIFNVFVIISSLFFLSVNFLLRKEKKPINVRFTRIMPVEKAAMGICAAGITLSAVSEFIKVLLPNAFISNESQNLYSLYGMAVQQNKYAIDVKGAITSLPALMLLFAVFAVIFTVKYIMDPRAILKSVFFRIASLSFTGYYVVRLFSIFIDSSTVISRAYGSYTILFLSAVVLFFMNFSKMLIGTPSKRLMFSFGLCSVFFGVIRTTEFVIMLIPNNPHGLDNNIFSYIADIATVLAVLSVILRVSLRRRRNRPAISESEPAKEGPVLIGENEDVNQNERMI